MSTNNKYMHSMVPQGSLESFIAWANLVPILSAEEEKTLTQAFFERQSVEAARRIITAHLRVVIKIARSYKGYGLALGDLIQEGNIGLMKALKRFNPAAGVRLVTYALHWIKAEIHEFILKNWRIVKVATTKAQRRLFFKVRSAEKEKRAFSQEEVKDLSNYLGVSTDVVRDMEISMDAVDHAFDPVLDGDYNEDQPQLQLGDLRYAPQQAAVDADRALVHDNIRQALKTLSDRERKVIELRWLDEDTSMSLTDLSKDWGVSVERVRQIQNQAMQKMKKVLAKNNVTSMQCY
ncbi:MAG: RNA polymerase factor sigma-32 [Candidatus Comchoanobacterales bacterium]